MVFGGVVLAALAVVTLTSSFEVDGGYPSYPVNWDDGSVAATPTATSSYEEAAYPVKWSPNAASSTPTTATTAFEEAAYPVKWSPRGASATPTTATTAFEEAAYPVKWSPRAASASPTPTTATTAFEEAAYPVKWSPRAASATPTTATTAFEEAAYPVKWSPRAPFSTPTKKTTSSAAAHGVAPGMLFLRKLLYPGAVLPKGTMLSGRNGTTPRFMFRKNAEALPFDYSRLDDVLQVLQIPRGSKKANQVAETLRLCKEYNPAEPHVCSTSDEAMVDFAAEALGTSDVHALVTVVRGEEAAPMARYVVDSFEQVRTTTEATAVVACHKMPYPYVVYFCHRPTDVEILRVELLRRGVNEHDDAGRGGASAVAMCHSDTANWSPLFFGMLHATPGETICHYMPSSYLTWVSA